MKEDSLILMELQSIYEEYEDEWDSDRLEVISFLIEKFKNEETEYVGLDPNIYAC